MGRKERKKKKKRGCARRSLLLSPINRDEVVRKKRKKKKKSEEPNMKERKKGEMKRGCSRVKSPSQFCLAGKGGRCKGSAVQREGRRGEEKRVADRLIFFPSSFSAAFPRRLRKRGERGESARKGEEERGRRCRFFSRKSLHRIRLVREERKKKDVEKKNFNLKRGRKRRGKKRRAAFFFPIP